MEMEERDCSIIRILHIKAVIPSQGAHWRGNPFLKMSRYYRYFGLKRNKEERIAMGLTPLAMTAFVDKCYDATAPLRRYGTEETHAIC